MLIIQTIVKLFRLMGVRGVAIALTFLQTVVLTKGFGAQVFGLYSFAISISAILILLLSFGLDQVIMRGLAREGYSIVGSQSWQNYISIIKVYVIPLTLVVSIFGVLIGGMTDAFGVYKVPLIAMFAALPLVLARKYLESTALGAKQVIRSIIGSQIVFPFGMVSFGALVLWFSLPATIGSLALLYCLSCAVSLLLTFILVRAVLHNIKNYQSTSLADEEQQGRKRILSSGMHFSILSLGFILGQHVDVLVMGFMGVPEDVALVRIALRMAEIAALMRTIVLLQYKPLIAEAHGKNDNVLLQKHAKMMVLLFMLGGLPVAFGLWVFAEPIMVFFDPSFQDTAWVMRVYLVGVVIMLLFGPSNAILSMCNEEKRASKNLVITLLIQIGLNLVLIPHFGPMGCAISSCISLLFLAFVSRYQVMKKLAVEPSVFGLVSIARFNG